MTGKHYSLIALSGASYSCIFHCTVSVKLRKQIQSATIDDQDIFLNINTVSLARVDHVLRRNTLRMKQVYRVPFNRNSDKVKQLCYDYVQVSHKAPCTPTSFSR